MHRLKTSSLLLVLCTLSIAQNPMDFIGPEVKRVGMKLACLCGTCRNTVGDCSMLGCGYSFPARQKIKKYQTMGATDASIVGRFIKEDGLKVLAEPQTQGFGLLGWIMPFFAISAGLLGVALYVKRFRKPEPLPVIQVDPSTLADFEAKAAKDIEGMEG